MKILFVNQHANAPSYGNPYRHYYLAKELVKQGHDVCIITASYSHVRQKQPQVSKRLTVEEIDGITFLWLKVKPYNLRVFSRVYGIFSFLWCYYRESNSILSLFKPDVVYEATPHLLPFFISKKVAKKSRAKLIFEVRDLWPLSIVEVGGYSKKNIFVKLLSYAQRKAVTESDLIVSNLKFADKYYLSQGIQPNSFFYLPNGVDPNDFENNLETDVSFKFEQIRQKYKNIVGYIGSIGLANSVDVLVESSRYINNETAVVIVGSGQNKKVLQDKAHGEELNNVFFLEPVSKKQIKEVLDNIDLGFVGGRSRELHKYGVSPNKLYDYMYNSVPVLFALKTKDNIVEKSNAGITVKDFTPEGIARDIDSFFLLDQKTRNFFGVQGHLYVLENNEYSKLAKKLTTVLF